MMAAVLQLSVVRSILFFVTLVLWTDEQYDYGDVSHSFGTLSVLVLPVKPLCSQAVVCGGLIQKDPQWLNFEDSANNSLHTDAFSRMLLRSWYTCGTCTHSPLKITLNSK